METVAKKKAPPHRAFMPEFKAEIVERCRVGDRSIAEVARDLDLVESAVRGWVEQAEIDAGGREGLTSSEREELARLRRENRPVAVRHGSAQASDGFLREGDPVKPDLFIEADAIRDGPARTLLGAGSALVGPDQA